MRYLIFLLVSVVLFASNLEITADKFMADEAKGVSVFTGKVNVNRGKDNLKADKVVIKFDKKKHPTLYTATGHAQAKISIKNKSYFVKGDTLIYDPVALKYTIEKNAFLQELNTDKKVYGDKIWVDQTKGYYEVDGKKDKPVKFIFKIEDKKK